MLDAASVTFLSAILPVSSSPSFVDEV